MCVVVVYDLHEGSKRVAGFGWVGQQRHLCQDACSARNVKREEGSISIFGHCRRQRLSLAQFALIIRLHLLWLCL